LHQQQQQQQVVRLTLQEELAAAVQQQQQRQEVGKSFRVAALALPAAVTVELAPLPLPPCTTTSTMCHVFVTFQASQQFDGPAGAVAAAALTSQHLHRCHITLACLQ
jgi:hypothetical protein